MQSRQRGLKSLECFQHLVDVKEKAGPRNIISLIMQTSG